MTGTTMAPRRLLRSVGALFLGFAAVVALSIGTDMILHAVKIYPPIGEPMHAPALNLVALAYRCVYAVLGSYIAARLAPNAPMGHALALGVIGLAVSLAGLFATSGIDLGPRWYPIALVVSTLPCAWLGGVVHRSTLVSRGPT